MKLALGASLIAVLGLLLLAFVPAGLRSGVAAGWLAGCALEALSLRARLRARLDGASLIPALVGGFLARMSLLLGGTLAGAFTGLWSAEGFLAACAGALLLGESLAFALLRRPPPSPSRTDSDLNDSK